MFVHPGNADEVAAKFDEIEDCQVVVTREGHVDQMAFKVVLAAGATPSEALANRIEAAIPESMRVRGKVEFIDRGILPENFSKIDDQRKWE